ncbi:MAG: MaoC/PaaZ C-terminal domain-containing protein [Gammaproteobacteria bacterium]
MTFSAEKLLGWKFKQASQTYTERDTMLYALGVGVGSTDPLDAGELRYCYEKDLVALPTMAVVLAPDVERWVEDPNLGVDFTKLLHGEQMLTVHRPLPPAATVTGQSKFLEIYDKGREKGAVVYMEREIRNAADGTLLATLTSSAFLRGNGGCGGNTGESPKPHPIPADRPPDVTLDLPTRIDQALIYRLSGDYNPLHIDPAVGTAAGFPKPILHGLCSYGTAGRAIARLFCGNDATRLRVLNVRFSSPVYPGETIRTEAWRDGPGKAAFRCRVVERDVVVLNNGRAEFAA